MITDYQQTLIGNLVSVTVTSDLSGTVYYHWYVDGTWVASTTAASYAFRLAVGDQVQIEVIDTTDAAFDPVAGAPAGYPARSTLWWIRVLDADVDGGQYRIEQKQDAGDWTVVGQVAAEAGRWDYSFLTPRLVDLADYTWRIVPVDRAGNDGTPIVRGPRKIVRRPDAPRFAIAFDEGTLRVTFSEAV